MGQPLPLNADERCMFFTTQKQNRSITSSSHHQPQQHQQQAKLLSLYNNCLQKCLPIGRECFLRFAFSFFFIIALFYLKIKETLVRSVSSFRDVRFDIYFDLWGFTQITRFSIKIINNRISSRFQWGFRHRSGSSGRLPAWTYTVDGNIFKNDEIRIFNQYFFHFQWTKGPLFPPPRSPGIHPPTATRSTLFWIERECHCAMPIWMRHHLLLL